MTNRKWRMLDLFSGIGGFAYAAQQVWGDELEITAFCEIDPYCQKVLKKHWPDVPIVEDIKKLTVDSLANLSYIDPKQEDQMKNYDEAVKMYNQGLSIGEVSGFYGISRQAMWKILQRRGVEFRSNLKFGEDNHFHRGGSTASDKAQNLLEEAIGKGIIKRLSRCQQCNESPTFKDGRTAIHAHHCDYNKPLDVMWLCQKCHHEWHKTNKAVPRNEVMPDEANRIDIVTGGFP